MLEKKVDGSEFILKGKDLKPFKFTEPSQFIKFDKSSFQQCSDEKLFRAEEKLIYRFISNKLIFSYDNKGTLTLNSANFIIPKLDIPVKVVLAILQSSISQFLFESKFNSVKVLKKHIQELPIFIFPDEVNKEIERIVTNFLKSDSLNASETINQINSIIYKNISLNEDDIRIIEGV